MWLRQSIVIVSLWVVCAAPLPAVAVQQDKGPMPPPEGPYFSSKPLLYYGEEIAELSNDLVDYVPPAVTIHGGEVNRYPPYDMAPSAMMPYRPMPFSNQPWQGQRRYPPGYPQQYNYPGYPNYGSMPQNAGQSGY